MNQVIKILLGLGINQKTLLKLGMHYWEYSGPYRENGWERICKWTGKKQYYVYEGPAGGYADIEYWVTVK